MSLMLPKSPSSRQYDDLVAASLSALGYYLEARLRFVGNSAVPAEYDILAMPGGEAFLTRLLVEPKAEAWGCGDVFRLYGWRSTLGIDQARLVHLEEPAELRPDSLRIVANRLAVPCFPLAMDKFNLDRSVPRATAVSEVLRRKLIEVGWLAQMSHRMACAQFAVYGRQHETSELWAAAMDLRSALETSFYQAEPLARLAVLFDAQETAANLIGRLVEEQAPHAKRGQIEVWEKLKDSPEVLWLQYAMLLEHRLRVAMVRAGLEYVLGGKVGDTPVTFGRRAMTAGEFWNDAVPETFRATLGEWAAGPLATRLPYALQSFVEMFGGFYVDRPEELDLMALVWGVRGPDAASILASLDSFFPTPKSGSWYSKEEGGLVFLKNVPAFVRGAGCLMRASFYELTDYKKKYPGVDLRLARWHGSLAKVLEFELKPPTPPLP
jgi:hypothetical protein